MVKLEQNKLILVESKYNNLLESVINTLNPQFFKDIYQKEIVDRLVITDGINSRSQVKNIDINLINLQDFLERE